MFVSTDGGQWRELNIGVSEDPYHALDQHGRKIVNADGSWWSTPTTTLHAKWHSSGSAGGRFSASTPFLIYPSPDARFVVIVFNSRADVPHNALVLNADGSVRHHIQQPGRYAGQRTEFLDTWWYERSPPPFARPWWAFWRHAPEPVVETRMKMLIGWPGDPTGSFEALDFDPEAGTFGDMVDSGRL
ncbi:hypothetical protein [Denitromonas halophila]|uniref:Uncharacterized protein n=1 Tax=Denitromonas halophila TaxID=1629404 RepID=A0A557QWF2_9RHOO|nr:hypothetical protein [Denitromonas halophila]TVO57244.1 hypothetical protein FHP91_10135 [Denitromonas halophila]